jgi:hypothetical protein
VTTGFLRVPGRRRSEGASRGVADAVRRAFALFSLAVVGACGETSLEGHVYDTDQNGEARRVANALVIAVPYSRQLAVRLSEVCEDYQRQIREREPLTRTTSQSSIAALDRAIAASDEQREIAEQLRDSVERTLATGDTGFVTTADIDARFRFDDLPKGEYYLWSDESTFDDDRSWWGRVSIPGRGQWRYDLDPSSRIYWQIGMSCHPDAVATPTRVSE